MDNPTNATPQAADSASPTTPTPDTAQVRRTHTRLLTANDVANRLNISEARAYELARHGIIPCVRLGRQVRFDPIKLEDWIESGGQSLPGGWRITTK